MGLLSRLFELGGGYGGFGNEYGMEAIPGVTPFAPHSPSAYGAGAPMFPRPGATPANGAQPGTRENPYEQPPAPNSANANIGRMPTGPISPATANASPFTAPPGFMTPQPQPASGAAPAPAAPNAPQRGGLFGAMSRGVEGFNAPAFQRFGAPANTGGLTNMDMLTASLALMGAGAPGGGGWGQFAQSLQGINQGAMDRQDRTWQRQRAETADARAAEQWSWARSEREQTAERRRLAQEYINSRPAAEQAELRMIDPDELGSYLQERRGFGLQERQLELQLAEMRDNRAFRGASLDMDRRRLEQDRILNSSAAVLGREEAQRLGGDIQRLRGWSVIDNDMAALEEILNRNPAAFNNLLDADAEQALARIRDPQTRRDVQTIYSIATSMAREELRGQTPVSNIDLLSAVRGAPSPSSGAAFARDWINRAYQDRSDLETYVQGAINYMQQPDGSRRTLFDTDPATGRNFYQGDAFRRYTQDGRESFSDVRGGPRGGRSDEAASAAAALEARRRAQTSRPANNGTLGGRAGAPPLLREPNSYEATMVRQYEEARRSNNPGRVRTLETRLRQRGLIP